MSAQPMNEQPAIPVSKLMLGILVAMTSLLGFLGAAEFNSLKDLETGSNQHYTETETRLATIETLIKMRGGEDTDLKAKVTGNSADIIDLSDRMARIEWAGRPPRRSRKVAASPEPTRVAE